jgi:hypothetical protein
MSNGQSLAGKIAVITGGSSGIGLATARRFVEEGAHVVITGRREKELKEAAAFIRKNVTTVVGDVSRLEDLDRLYAVVQEKHGHIDVIFANAGAGTIAPLAVATEAHFDQTFDVNVKGLFFTVQKALPLFKDGGSIVLNSSVSNVSGLPGFSVYAASKAAVRNFPSLTGANPSCLAKIRHGSDRVLVVAGQKDDPVAALDDRVGSQFGCTQVVKTFHQLSAGERLRNEGGGQESIQIFGGNSKRVHRVDDRLVFPTRQALRNLAMLAKRDCQDDRVGLECIPQRPGDDRGANRPSLRCQRLGRPATRDCHVDVLTGKGVVEGLANLAESYNCIAHKVSPVL